MKKRIYLSIFFTGIITTILTAVLLVYAFYGFFVEHAKSEVRTGSEIVHSSIELLEDNESYLDTIKGASKEMRITLINKDGVVTFDSQSNPSSMPNHGEREEVKQARETGVGEALRRSETIGKDTYYYAFLLSDGYVLRGSRNIDSITNVFINIIPILLGIALIFIFVSILVSSYLTKKLMKPLDLLADNLGDIDTPIPLVPYDEFIPFFNKLSEQRNKIKETITSLKYERDTVNTITHNMQEGLIIVNSDYKILSANNSAITLLDGSTAFSYNGKPVISLIADEDLTHKLESVINKGSRKDAVINKGSKQCRMFMNPVYEAGKIAGAIIIVIDITDIYKAELIRREFSANVSHELKTPLTSITGFAEMIETGIVKDQADTIKFAGNIQKEAGRLITLVDDIIRLTEIEDNSEGTKLNMEMAEIDLLSMCNEAVSSLSFAAQKKNVKLNVSGSNIIIKANKYMISELLHNLIDNAIKYNKHNGAVNISINADEQGRCVLKVNDNGIGIANEHLERIFERFYRVDKSRSKQNGGTGLGLSIVKHIAVCHDADINIESEPSLGTTITVRFQANQ